MLQEEPAGGSVKWHESLGSVSCQSVTFSLVDSSDGPSSVTCRPFSNVLTCSILMSMFVGGRLMF